MPRQENLIEEKFNWIFERLNELKEDQRKNNEEIKCRLQSLDNRLLKLRLMSMREACLMGGVTAILIEFLMKFLSVKG